MGRARPVILANRTFKTQGDAMAHFGSMLAQYKPGDRVNQGDHGELASMLERHPEATSKIGCGIDHFEVQDADFGSQCFRVVRQDKTWARFSYHSCVAGRDVHKTS
ncbi:MULTISPECIES: DCL family protein [unclassified Mesorhizobium]|uniref:DCL family protein n=1 Tax=unclassified Mesorhizobium TaxID=325217 RepID=UPI0033379082